jgi:hypothetical protein
MFNVCTVITKDYLHKALALLFSMTPFHPVRMHCLLAEKNHAVEELRRPISVEGGELICYGLDDIYDERAQARLSQDKDRMQWTSKARFMGHLLESEGIRSLLYLDNDLCFFGDFEFLFQELKEHSLLLTPHWRPLDPDTNEEQFFCNFRDGIYNAGFLGAASKGLDALNWWHKACLHRCEFDYPKGYYVDQRYLDAFPVYFEDVKIIKHLGCNIAQWNADYLRREASGANILINGRWPLIFIHFSDVTIHNIEHGNDTVLKPQLFGYRELLRKAGQSLVKAFSQ